MTRDTGGGEERVTEVEDGETREKEFGFTIRFENEIRDVFSAEVKRSANKNVCGIESRERERERENDE